MSKLSNKRRVNAVWYGKSYMESIIKDWIDHPEYFGKGVESLPAMAGRLASVNYYTSCTHSPTDEEKQIVYNSAVELGNLFVSAVQTSRTRT